MFKLLKKPGIAAFILTLSALHSVQSNALALAETPLFLSAGADPNILFILDDSGSMQYEVIPETLMVNNSRFLFPRANGVYGGYEFSLGQSNVAIPGSATSVTNYVFGRVTRSPAHNKIYYNPAIRYIPWVRPQGGLFPDASPTCALHNPMRPLPAGQTFNETYCRNLIANDDRTFAGNTITWVTCSALNACGTSTSSVTYYPATYYRYNSTSTASNQVFNANNYTEVRIQSSTATYTGDGRDAGKRTDCVHDDNGTFQHCTYAQEIQNFANWYTYYRSRLLTAHAGIGRAFAAQGDGIRVGFGAINKGVLADGLPASTVDGTANTRVVIRGVRQFTAAEKQNFLQTLYTHPLALWTPLREALYYAGQYFERTDNAGPWGAVPGTNDSTPHLACRRSNTILMTDGYWSDHSYNLLTANIDGTAGSQIVNHEPGATPANYTYSPTTPFTDTASRTLADVAMHYWKRDLRTDLQNRVKGNEVNPAFWQHMTTFGVGLGVTGTITHITNENFSQVITEQQSITWPTPTASNTSDITKIDDLLHASINGRGGFFSAQDPESFSEELSTMLKDITSRENNNAAAAAANSTNLNNESVMYQALFSTVDWSGQIRAIAVAGAGALGDILWTSSVPSPASRRIFTYNDEEREGVAFEWGSISDNQRALLQGQDSEAIGQARFDWVRGIEADGLRNRNGRLVGDIVNSDPEYAGNRNSRFDRFSAALGGDSYYDYYHQQKKERAEVLYVGANDGMLHGFNAVTGVELFAYVPSQIYSKLPELSVPTYGKETPHRYTVDGPIYVGDAYINGSWRNLLVGTLGAGGRGIFVLDVTDPTNFGPDNVLFELSEAQYPELGNVLGKAIVAPGKDNRWKIYLGNGVNSSSGGTSQSFLGVIDIEDELNKAPISRTRFIPTSAMEANGLSEPELWPDSDGTIRAAYAGDIQGNLWKFDLSSTNSSSWAIAYNAPLFIAQRGGVRQPITVAPTLGVNTEITPAVIMVYFGTGQYLTDADRARTDIQTFYAIADKNTNISSTDRSTLHMKSIAAASSSTQRIIDGQVTLVNGVPTNAVDWSSVDGWYLDFVPGERVVARAQLRYDRLIFPTVIPNDDPCSAGGTGWFMELIGVGIGNLEYSMFGTQANTSLDTAIFGGVSLLEGYSESNGGTSSSTSSLPPSSSSAPSSEFCLRSATAALYSQADGVAGNQAGVGICDDIGRQSWRELR